MTRKRYLLLNLFHIAVDGLFDSVPVLLAFMAAAFGGGEREVGLIVGLGVLVGTVGGLATRFAAARWGFGNILSLTALLYGVGFFANAFSRGMFFSGVFFIAATAGHTLFHNAAFAHLSTRMDRSALGKTLSDFTAFGDIGRIPLVSLAGFAAAGTILGLPGWRAVCLVYGLAALGLALALIARPPFGERESNAADSSVRLLPSFSLLRHRPFARVLAASMLNAFAGDQAFVFLPLLLFAKGIDPKAFGAFAFAFTAGCFVGKMAFGRLIDRFGNRAVFAASQTLAAIFSLGLVFAVGFAPVIAAAILLGVVNKGAVPVVQTLLTDSAGDKRHYHDAFTLNSLLRGAVNTVAPALMGMVASMKSVETIYVIMAAAAVASIVPIAAGVGREAKP